MAKLSRAQIKCLRILRDTPTTIMMNKASGGSFYRKLLHEWPNIRIAGSTVWALQRKGLLNDITRPEVAWRDLELAISDKGLKALEKA